MTTGKSRVSQLLMVSLAALALLMSIAYVVVDEKYRAEQDARERWLGEVNHFVHKDTIPPETWKVYQGMADNESVYLLAYNSTSWIIFQFYRGDGTFFIEKGNETNWFTLHMEEEWVVYNSGASTFVRYIWVFYL